MAKVGGRRRRFAAMIGALFVTGLFAVAMGGGVASAASSQTCEQGGDCNPCATHDDDCAPTCEQVDSASALHDEAKVASVTICKYTATGISDWSNAAGWTFTSAASDEGSATTDGNGQAVLHYTFEEACDDAVSGQTFCDTHSDDKTVTITETQQSGYHLDYLNCRLDNEEHSIDQEYDYATNSVTLTIDSDDRVLCEFDNLNQSDLSLTKTLSGSLITGTNATYNVKVTNEGPDATVDEVTLQDVLPAGLTYVSSSGTGWTCVNTSGTVNCSYSGSIADGASSTVSLTVTVTAAAGATVKNCATVTGGDTWVAETPSVVDPTVEANDTGCDSASGIQVEAALAFTGSNTMQTAAIGFGVLMVGFGTTLLARRRRNNA